MDFMKTKESTVKNTLKSEQISGRESQTMNDNEQITSQQKQRSCVVTPEAKQIYETEPEIIE